ncbi:hypothetical protein TrispH2_002305 [Trichoplax sp. H2]|nr:hypothetical protein TrispH2_002305 [Trichoplax sp. H2]|eukprot:RDD45331.1 hypothetical protein TrispH2_002305 [Trichoplax sp. H2]
MRMQRNQMITVLGGLLLLSIAIITLTIFCFSTKNKLKINQKPKQDISIYGDSIAFQSQACKKLQTFLFFIGYPRSGHSLIGSIIDAHPHAIVAHEYDVIGKWPQLKSSKNDQHQQLLYQLYNNSRYHAVSGKRAPTLSSSNIYSYHIPNEWQGRYQGDIKVIGDKQGGKTTRHFRLDEQKSTAVVDYLKLKLRIDVKFIHVVRNPYDVISTAYIRRYGKRQTDPTKQQEYISNVDMKKLRRIINHFFADAKINWHLKDRLNDTVLDIYTSDVIANPKKQVMKICLFLQLECSQQYISHTTGIIHAFQSKTRNYIYWPPNLIKMVAKRLIQYPFLSQFTFKN